MISAIVLAAGLSTRMGELNKLLLDLHGQPMIRIVVARLLASAPGEIIIVLGHESQSIKAALAGLDLVFVMNERYTEGMTSSIQAGVSLAKGHGYMICLSDMYAIEASEYTDLMAFFKTERELDADCICIPVFEGTKGNPVIFSNSYREKILYHQELEGCRDIIIENEEHLRKKEMPQAHVLQDLDSPGDYGSIQNR